MTRRRRWFVFAGAAVAISATLIGAVLLALDVYLHGRYQRSAGFNVWGYRGSVVGRKQPNEYRVVVLGGSAAYGYGVTSDEAIPAQLERLLRKRTPSPIFTVVNLGYNNEGAYSFKATLDDYAWLRYDLALLYEGYNDLSLDRVNTQVFRHESPVFRLTGYMPIFPIIFREKAAAMTGGKTEFHAGLATTAGATVLSTTADIARSLEAQLGRVASEPPARVEDGARTGCGVWSTYCTSIEAAVETARRHGSTVIVATQPYLRTGEQAHTIHIRQQTALREFVVRRFAAATDIRYVDLGDAVNLEDSRLSFDHMHLRREGNERVAELLVEPVLAAAVRRSPKTS